MNLGISFRIICLFFSFQSGSGGIFLRVAKEQLGLSASGLFLFDLRSCGPWGWLRSSDLGEAKWAVGEIKWGLAPFPIVSLICFLCASLLVSLSHILFSFCLVFHLHLWAFFFSSGVWESGWEGKVVIRQIWEKERYFLSSLIFLNLLYCQAYAFTHILFSYICADLKLQLPFRLCHCLSSVVIDAVTMKDTCSALQVHVSASKSSAYIFNKGFSRLLFQKGLSLLYLLTK